MKLISSNITQKFNVQSITKSKCVFEIKNFEKYTWGEEICSEKVDIFESDIEWRVKIHPSNKHFTLFDLEINLKSDDLWKSKRNEYRFSGALGELESSKIFATNFIIIDRTQITFSSHCQRSILINSGTGPGPLVVMLMLEIKQFEDPKSLQKKYCATNQKLVDQYLNLLSDSTFSDFTFIVKGMNFKVHKSILASKSETMQAMFTSNLREAASAECIVDHIEPDIFKHMLHFIYAGIISPNFDDITLELYEAAHYYRIVKLMDICRENIRFSINAGNALKIYELATVYDMEDVKVNAWKIIKSQLLNVSFPLKNEPLPLNDIQEIIDMKQKEEEFWLKHKKCISQ